MNSESNKSDKNEMLILGHCILNMNTRAPGIAAWPGSIFPILRALRNYNGEIHQYPCPETAVVGSRRWWHVKEQYDTFTFRNLTKKLAMMYVNYSKRVGINKVKLLGLGLSPTCGYRYTQSDIKWGGRPREIDPTEEVKKGAGVLIEEMINEFKNSGVKLEVLDVSPSLIYPDYKSRILSAKEYPDTPEGALKEIEFFIHTQIPFNQKEVAHIFGLKDDLRSKQTIVVPRKVFEVGFEKVVEYAEKGIGISLIEDIYGNEEEKEFLSLIYSSMIGNMIYAGHNVKIMIMDSKVDELTNDIITKLEELIPKDKVMIIKY